MSVESTTSFLDRLEASRVVSPAQLDGLRRDPRVAALDAKALAKHLVRNSWLTSFQAVQIFQGYGKELLLGPYCLLDRIGEGGMGAVFKAQHQMMNRVVALKVIRQEKLAHPDAVKRFYQEIQAAAQLAHPNIVVAYDAGQVGAVHYFAMEYVEGADLRRVVHATGPLTVPHACELMRQAALGLHHAFERGLVHRDIKPSNLLVANVVLPKEVDPGKSTLRIKTTTPSSAQSKAHVLKILDLGLARLQGDAGDDNGVTRDGVVVGTPDFIAPEQARNARTVDIRSDLYSLGCTFYYALAGKPPFRAASLTEVLLKHVMEEAEPLNRLSPDLPPAVDAIIRRLMAKDPAQRYQQPGELAAALELICKGRPIDSVTPAAVQQPARPAVQPRCAELDWASIASYNDDTPNGTASSASGLTPVLTGVWARQPKRRQRPWYPALMIAVFAGVLALTLLAALKIFLFSGSR